MKLETPITMTLDAGQKLLRMANAAAQNASASLAKFSGERVTISIAKVEIKPVQRVFPGFAPETVVAGIYLPVTGDIKGAALLVFPEEVAMVVCDVLLKREPDTTRTLSAVDVSALTETGNILSGSFLAVLSNTMRIRIVEHVPNFSLDMFGAVADVLIGKMAALAADALVIEVRFTFEREKKGGHVLFILGIENLPAILDAVNKPKRGA